MCFYIFASKVLGLNTWHTENNIQRTGPIIVSDHAFYDKYFKCLKKTKYVYFYSK